ncbi:unnamed protein product [Diamesa serratosioi]
MKLNKIFLRYFPPGLAFNYVKNNNQEETKCVDIFELTVKSDLDLVLRNLMKREPKLITKYVLPQIKELLEKMQAKLHEPTKNKYYLYKTFCAHILPLTNVDFDRSGKRCISGSYDRTCRIWNVDSGEEMNVLKGHENVVFSVAFNYPKCDKIVTGSFDKTAKIWSSGSGACLNTLWGHTGEIVGTEFNKNAGGDLICTVSMDGTSIIWSTETAQEINNFRDHEAEVISGHFNNEGTLVITGSFDETAIVWDLRSKGATHVLRGHEAELSNCIWNFSCDKIATSSLDSSVRVWDLRNVKRPQFQMKHDNEVLDVCFDYTGRIASCSSDCTAKVWSLEGGLKLVSTMEGHTDEVSKVTFSPNGRLLLTASADKTARLWCVNDEMEKSLCSQVLTGHDNEVFSCAFNYSADAILTASKDNTCKIWR